MRTTLALLMAAIMTTVIAVGGHVLSVQAHAGSPFAATAGDNGSSTASGQATAASDQPMMAAQPAPSGPLPAGAPAAGPLPGSTRPLLHPARVSVASPGFWSWALLNRGTGQITGSANLAATNVTASMTKAWLAADYLHEASLKRQKPPAAMLTNISIMIRDSDNDAAADIYAALGGPATITRLVRTCGLTDTKANIDWANALMSARDAVRMAGCIGDGRAAGPQWTNYLLNEMRNVRGAGRFGIISALPPAAAKVTAIKNGWTARTDGKWHVNCMAIGPDWALAVMLVYPANRGLPHGAAVCKSIATQLMA